MYLLCEHKLDKWWTMHTSVVVAVWLTQVQSLSLCSDHVIKVWRGYGWQRDPAGFGVVDDTTLTNLKVLRKLRMLGESLRIPGQTLFALISLYSPTQPPPKAAHDYSHSKSV